MSNAAVVLCSEAQDLQQMSMAETTTRIEATHRSSRNGLTSRETWFDHQKLLCVSL